MSNSLHTLPTRQVVYLMAYELKGYRKNSRTHTPAQIEQIAASMREFGFTNPVLILPDYTILAGHGRVAAAQSIGQELIPCIILDNLTPEQAAAYVIADNKIALNAGWDDSLLTEELRLLEGAEFDLSLTGFSFEEIESLLRGVDEEIPQPEPEEKPLQLVFGKYKVPITPEESEDLGGWVEQHAKDYGDRNGFVARILLALSGS